MKNELEKVFDSIAASTVPAQEDYTDKETGLLHCGNCHTPSNAVLPCSTKKNSCHVLAAAAKSR